MDSQGAMVFLDNNVIGNIHDNPELLKSYRVWKIYFFELLVSCF